MVNSEKVPRVSIIIPCYNHGRYLRGRIEGILAQTFQDFEWIFLDDASTDDSRAVFEEFRGEPRLQTAVFNECNSGNLFIQWNRGFQKARGEFVWVAESDDGADPTFLERLVALMDAHPTVGIAYCQSRMVDENGNLLYLGTEHTRDIDDARWRQDYVEDGKTECDRYLSRRNTIPNVSACLIRRTALAKAGYAHTQNRFCEDWLLYVRILQFSDIAFLAEPLNICRCHAGNTRTRNVRSGEIEEFYAVLRKLRAMKVGSEDSLEFLAAHIFSRWGLQAKTTPENFPLFRWLSLVVAGVRSDSDFLKRVRSALRHSF